MATTTIPAARFASVSTVALIEQYELAISSSKGRRSNCAPRQKRINTIVNMLSDRADLDDSVALAWFKH